MHAGPQKGQFLSQSPLGALLALLSTVPKWQLFALLGLFSASAATDGLGIMMLVPLLDLMEQGQASHSDAGMFLAKIGVFLTLNHLLIAFVTLAFVRTAILMCLDRLQVHLQHAVTDALSRKCFDGLIRAEWHWLSQKRATDHQATLMTNIAIAGTGLSQAMTLASGLFMALIYLTTAILLSWQATLAVLAFGAFGAFSFANMRRRAVLRGDQVREAQHDLHKQVQESLTAARLIKVFGKEGHASTVFAETVAKLRGAKSAHVRDTNLMAMLFQFSGAVMIVGIIALGVGVWQISLPVMLPLVLVFSRLSPLFSNLHQSWHHWLHAVPATVQVQSLLKEVEQFAEPCSDFRGMMCLKDSLTLHTIRANYADRQTPALNGISLCIKARTTTAIIGPSGAGKSTLADVILGLIVPEVGEIKLDGRPLLSGDRMQWRKSIAYVQQDAFLFHQSIRENLLWANPEASEADLRRVLTLASADFVFDLPLGLDTMAGDSGSRLSGGERQRITLARALLLKPTLLILDEATSALDPRNEAAFRRAVQKLHGQITVILIGHRLTMLDDVDQIIKLRDGKIVRTSANEKSELAQIAPISV